MLTLNFCANFVAGKNSSWTTLVYRPHFAQKHREKLGKNVSSCPEFRCMKNLPSILKLLFVELLLALTSLTNDILFQAQGSLFAP